MGTSSKNEDIKEIEMNNMNPMAMMKVAGMMENFKRNHPKVFPFVKEAGNRIKEGSVIEITITDPSGESITSNIRVMADDIEMVQALKEMGMNG